MALSAYQGGSAAMVLSDKTAVHDHTVPTTAHATACFRLPHLVCALSHTLLCRPGGDVSEEAPGVCETGPAAWSPLAPCFCLWTE